MLVLCVALLSNISLDMYHSMFIHSVADGNFGCFQCLVIMNKAAERIHSYTGVFVCLLVVFLGGCIFTFLG